MSIDIVRASIPIETLAERAATQFGDMVKAVVDLDRGIMAIGGELHSDEEETLLEDGSEQRNLWGINIYPLRPHSERIEFDSLINIRPSAGNRSRGVEHADTRTAIVQLLDRLITG